MNRKKTVWRRTAILIVTAALPPALAGVTFLWNIRAATVELCVAAAVLIVLALNLQSIRRASRMLIESTALVLDPRDRAAVFSFPLPLSVVGETGEIVLYNEAFKNQCLGGVDLYGGDLKTIVRNLSPASFAKPGTAVDVVTRRRRFTVYGNPLDAGFYALYWVENTELKNIADEFRESRPVVAVVMIDNYDELMQNAREGEKAGIVSRIEKELMAWVGGTTGFLRHSDRDKYLFVFEERHLRKIVENRFDILDNVRGIVAGEHMPATLSIGVGRGARNFSEAEEMARQALDMALGRGGDQAAVKSPTGFEFYGGVSKTVEKRTRVKARIIAAALGELIESSDNVLIMGHRNGDLDSLGASVALYRACIARGRDARIVLNENTHLAADFIADLKQEEGYADAFIAPEECLMLVMKRTLLIVVDTHRKGFVESRELYRMARTVVVIDHHRKMVDFIDNAVVFYHETYASSSSEMVAELMQYIADSAVTATEANALLAGITLDTRNFSVRTGVRTFEAAGYLRRKGADTALVRRLFSGTLASYRKRTRLVAAAEMYKNCAVAVYRGEPDAEIKLIAPQAADDLLTITGVLASFVLYADGEGVAFSSRSMGAVNVQLVMEQLGGGGHLTMAGAQMGQTTLAEAKDKLLQAIDRYFEVNKA